MRYPFFGGSREAGPVRIPLPQALQVAYTVYFHGSDRTVPMEAELQSAVDDWLRDHVEDPLFTAMGHWRERGCLHFRVDARSALPEPPAELIETFQPGELEKRRFQEATHVALVWADEVLAHPRPGFWTALGAARAVALALSGAIVDPCMPCLLSVESCAAALPADGRPTMAEHIVLPTSTGRSGLARITSKGMAKFGLPELELRDAPPDLFRMLVPLLNGLAGYLLDATNEAAETAGAPPQELSVGPSVRFTMEDIVRAYRQAGGAEVAEEARGWAMIAVEYHPSRRGDSFVRLVPPRGFVGDHGVWLNDVLAGLFGTTADQTVNVRSGDETMEIAHRRAVAELPRVKQRFQAGLPVGDRLYVKHGFPTEGGDAEYMWVAVHTWSGDRIRGQLANDPQFRTDLRAGQTVELSEGDVYDWSLHHADGESEGGYTTRVLQDHPGDD